MKTNRRVAFGPEEHLATSSDRKPINRQMDGADEEVMTRIQQPEQCLNDLLSTPETVHVEIRCLPSALGLAEAWMDFERVTYFKYILAKIPGYNIIFGGVVKNHKDLVSILENDLMDGHFENFDIEPWKDAVEVVGGGGFYYDSEKHLFTSGKASETYGNTPPWAKKALAKHLEMLCNAGDFRIDL